LQFFFNRNLISDKVVPVVAARYAVDVSALRATALKSNLQTLTDPNHIAGDLSAVARSALTSTA
jgi:hypothetical protein